MLICAVMGYMLSQLLVCVIDVVCGRKVLCFFVSLSKIMMKMLMKYRLCSVGVLAVVTLLSLMPAQEFPQVDAEFADKWVHWLMYGVVTVVLGLEASWAKGGGLMGGLGVGVVMGVAVFAAVWGGVMEWCQAVLTTTRSGEWLDAVANGVGALCGALVLGACARFGRRGGGV